MDSWSLFRRVVQLAYNIFTIDRTCQQFFRQKFYKAGEAHFLEQPALLARWVGGSGWRRRADAEARDLPWGDRLQRHGPWWSRFERGPPDPLHPGRSRGLHRWVVSCAVLDRQDARRPPVAAGIERLRRTALACAVRDFAAYRCIHPPPDSAGGGSPGWLT